MPEDPEEREPETFEESFGEDGDPQPARPDPRTCALFFCRQPADTSRPDEGIDGLCKLHFDEMLNDNSLEPTWNNLEVEKPARRIKTAGEANPGQESLYQQWQAAKTWWGEAWRTHVNHKRSQAVDAILKEIESGQIQTVDGALARIQADPLMALGNKLHTSRIRLLPSLAALIAQEPGDPDGNREVLRESRVSQLRAIFEVPVKTIRAALAEAAQKQEQARELAQLEIDRSAAEQLQEQAAPFLDADNPLDEVGKELARIGLGGDLRIGKLIYLCATTRLLPKRPGILVGHAQLNAGAGTGKSYYLDRVKVLLPDSAYIEYVAGSPYVLVYEQRSFKHKVILYKEAGSIPGVKQGQELDPAAEMVRSLLQDNEATYHVTVKDEKAKGGRKTDEITKEGPSVLLTTCIDQIEEEGLRSRLYRFQIPETPEQQAAALEMMANLELAGQVPQPKPEFFAGQRLLQLAAPLDVKIPFVRSLLRCLKAGRVDSRLLRDANRLVSLIKGHAILNFRRRERDEKGRILATYADYQAVADLFVDQYEAAVSEAGPDMRRLVEMVETMNREHAQPSVHELAERLGRPETTIRRLVKVALRKGWLVNHEPRGTTYIETDRLRSGLRARLTIGEPLPHPCGLPTVEQIRRCKTPVSGQPP